jgi:nickel-dependent lactate racemase
LVKAALEDPIELPGLKKLARHTRDAVIVTWDRSRGTPSQITVPVILDELRTGGISADKVKVLVATGLHKDENSQ